jgi:hypothetical protein
MEENGYKFMVVGLLVANLVLTFGTLITMYIWTH